MKKFYQIRLVAVAFLIAWATTASSQDAGKQPLRLVQTISMPNVKGRLDHMDVDVKGKRLFVAGLENGTLEVVDLKAGKRIRSIPGFKKPQGALYVPELNKLFVASGDDGMLRVFPVRHRWPLGSSSGTQLLDLLHATSSHGPETAFEEVWAIRWHHASQNRTSGPG